MRLVIAGNLWFPTGQASASRVRNISLALSARGVRTHILAMAPTWHAIPLASARVRRYQGVTYERTSNFPTVVHDLSPWLIKPGERHGIAERAVWAACGYAGIPVAYRRLGDLIQQKRCDGLFLYGRLASQAMPLIRICHRNGIPVCLDITEHEHTQPEMGGRLNPMHWDALLASRIVPRKCDGITVITTAMESVYRSRGCDHVMVLPSLESWADTLPVLPASRNSTFRLTYVGSLLPRDAPGYLVELARALSRVAPRVRLQLIGRVGASGRDVLNAIASDPSVASIVDLVGTVSDDELRERMIASDALLLTRRDSEAERMSFPTRLVEFLRTGRPVFTAGVGDVAKYLDDGVHAYLMPTDEPAEAARRVATVALSPDRGASVGIAGWHKGRELFHRDRHAERLIAFFEAARARQRRHAERQS